nr:hypothetical protein CFP56_62731 [Quercus suber]
MEVSQQVCRRFKVFYRRPRRNNGSRLKQQTTVHIAAFRRRIFARCSWFNAGVRKDEDVIDNHQIHERQRTSPRLLSHRICGICWTNAGPCAKTCSREKTGTNCDSRVGEKGIFYTLVHLTDCWEGKIGFQTI